MDPAETERFKQALSTQGARVGQHEQALQGIMESLQNLTAGVTQLSGCLDQFSTQLNVLPAPAPAPAPPPPAPNIPVIHPGQPREPFIPTPVRYSGDSGTCSQFLHQCSLVFDQQPLTYSSDRTRIAFVMSLLSGKASAWAVAIAKGNPAICNSFPVFETEMLRVFDHPLQGKEAGNRFLSLLYVRVQIQSPHIPLISAFSQQRAGGALQGVVFPWIKRGVKGQAHCSR